MTNSSILDAFERFWEHVTTALGKKSDIDHTHAIIPRNLIDNSDFTNPVNQRGQTLYSIYNNGMTIDRWKLGSSSPVSVSVIVNENGLTVNFNNSPNPFATMRQRIPEGLLSPDKKYTFAVYYASKGLRVSDHSANSVSTYPRIDKYGDTYYAEFSMEEDETVVWAALYEGEYTVDTLPEYQPKGYGAELLECQRYYQIRSTNNVPAVDMRPTMISSSPTITSVSGGYAYSVEGF